MNAARLVKYRPWLYHLTDPNNLDGVRADWSLHSAASLLESAGLPADEVRRRRPEHKVIELDDKVVRLRDQAPLHPGNISLAPDFDFDDLVALINGFVFFWPGDNEGPSPYGRRHYARYESEAPVLLRIRSQDLLEVCGDTIVHACAYNSGAPRCTRGKGSPRGPQTFVPLNQFHRSVSRVVEIVVPGSLALPPTVEIGHSPEGPFGHFARTA